MIRIFIDWDMISPALSVASGIVTLHYSTTPAVFKEIAKFRVRKEEHSLGYKCIGEKGIPSEIFEAVKPQLNAMVRSFHDGMKMKKNSCDWVIQEDLDECMKNFNSAHKNISKYIGEKNGD